MGGLLSIFRKKAATVRFDSGRVVTLKRQIAAGGFAFVHLAEDSTGRQYALKKVLLQLPEQIECFQQEVRAHHAVQYSSRVVGLVDHSVLDAATQGECVGLLLLHYHKEGTIQDLLDRGQTLPLPTALTLAASLCRALHDFHSLSPPWAHRDVKPGNVLLCGGSSVVLMDLGSAAEATVHCKTRREALALQEKCAEHCTAPYRAPELFEVQTGSTVTAATDIWSVGCTLYAMIYGQSPFDGSALAAISGKMTFKTPPADPGNELPESVQRLIGSLACPEHQQRPTALQAAQLIEDTLHALA